jgi:acyl carrier protein
MTDRTAAALDREHLRSLIAETIDVDAAEVTDDAHFVEELEVDSLLALEIAVRLEQEYGVKIDEAEMPAITTFGRTYDLIAEKLRGRP